jgi:hypothetical protein
MALRTPAIVIAPQSSRRTKTPLELASNAAAASSASAAVRSRALAVDDGIRSLLSVAAGGRRPARRGAINAGGPTGSTGETGAGLRQRRAPAASAGA